MVIFRHIYIFVLFRKIYIIYIIYKIVYKDKNSYFVIMNNKITFSAYDTEKQNTIIDYKMNVQKNKIFVQYH